MSFVNRLNLALNERVWFAMQATRQRDKQVLKYLDSENIRYFVPMRYKIVDMGRRKKLSLVNAVPNLMFVYATAQEVEEARQSFSFFQFHSKLEGGLYYPIMVEREAMNNFIMLYQSTHLQNVTYLHPDDPALIAGVKVRLHSKNEVFDGLEGKLVKLENKSKKHLSLSIEGWLSIAVPIDKVDLIEKIK